MGKLAGIRASEQASLPMQAASVRVRHKEAGFSVGHSGGGAIGCSKSGIRVDPP